MSIEVRIPDEIENYKESVIAGLSIRQIVCGVIALSCGVPTYLLLNHISEDLATYATMIVVIPAFCIGFIKKDGYNFETFLKIKLNYYLSKSKRTYETSSDENILPYEISDYREVLNVINEKIKESGEENNVSNKSTKEKRKRIKKTTRKESSLIEISKKSSERKRKAAIKNIKATRRSFTAKKYEAKEKDKSKCYTQELSSNTAL